MQLAVELPDELAQQVLQQADTQLFIQKAIEKMLLEEQKSQARQNLSALMAKIPSSVSLADELIVERRRESVKELSHEDNAL